jgi:type IV pilus modification protein PilV
MANRTTRQMNEARRARAGFSMLEIMIALGVLSLGVLAMTAGQLAAIKLSGDSRSRTVAMSLAQQSLETVQTLSAQDVKDSVPESGTANDPNNPLNPSPDANDNITYNRSWTVEEDTPETGVITITIQIDWVDEQGVARTTRLRTLKADV